MCFTFFLSLCLSSYRRWDFFDITRVIACYGRSTRSLMIARWIDVDGAVEHTFSKRQPLIVQTRWLTAPLTDGDDCMRGCRYLTKKKRKTFAPISRNRSHKEEYQQRPGKTINSCRLDRSSNQAAKTNELNCSSVAKNSAILSLVFEFEKVGQQRVFRAVCEPFAGAAIRVEFAKNQSKIIDSTTLKTKRETILIYLWRVIGFFCVAEWDFV